MIASEPEPVPVTRTHLLLLGISGCAQWSMTPTHWQARGSSSIITMSHGMPVSEPGVGGRRRAGGPERGIRSRALADSAIAMQRALTRDTATRTS